jgi:UDP-glucose 4-epimerase
MTLIESNMQRVLVTGATGFIGRHLVDFLLANKYRVSVYSRHEFSADLFSGVNRDDWITGEIEDTRALIKACADADAVVHLANLSHVSLEGSTNQYCSNVESTQSVCQACLDGGTKRLVYLSSVLAENPRWSAYANSKKLAEDIVIKYDAENGGTIRTSILRPVNVYGPGMKGNVIGLIRGIRRRRMPPLPHLNNRVAMVSVHDVCRAILILLKSAQKSGKVYTLSDREEYTPVRIEAAIYRALRRRPPNWRVPRMVFFVASMCAEGLNRLRIWRNTLGLRAYRNLTTDSTSRCRGLEEDFGFTPTRSFEEELPSIVSSDITISN